MKVFKFGGASINSVERINNVAGILRSFSGEKIFIIISAMGKTTNALEKVTEAFYSGEREQALELFKAIKDDHNTVATRLNVAAAANEILKDIYTEVEWLLYDKPVREYDYYYDQIVCSGELMSTAIISCFFNSISINNAWVDVRDILRTDDNFRDASIDWEFSAGRVNEFILPILAESNIVITQGFIGSTDENESATLGREGSDYSAAIFANMLDAESETIWKDVEGVMNADPKKFNDAVFISYLSFDEVIEMAYYGAQVIHPKTIKPLQNKNIPLHVRCFLKPELAGTIIGSKPVHDLPPVIVVKENQVLITFTSRDFSLIAKTGVPVLNQLFEDLKILPNIRQSSAITMLCSFDDWPERIEKLALAASEHFEVAVEKNISLLTIRHYNDAIVERMTSGKNIVLMQKTKETIQVLMGN